jgi:cytochrome c556
MKRSFRLLLTLVALVLAAAISNATAQQKPYIPGLGDLMTMTVQPRHTKLGLAAREGNWPYAAYELHELKEAFDRAAKTWPKWRTFSIPEMMASVTKEPMAALERAIKAGDPNRVNTAYDELTAACNTCHRSADRGMIVIQSPLASAFPDQDFRPVKE